MSIRSKVDHTPVLTFLLYFQSMNLIAIALDNKTITVWNEGDIVDTVETRDIVVAMKFGSYNRSVLLSLTVK